MHPWEKHRFLFICGLHRSGTTLLHDVLANSHAISGFRQTGFYGREGQHVQSVYPIEDEYGGAGRMGFRDAAHLTETSPLVTMANRRLLFEQWSAYWDLSRPILLEKTPANILKTRFLQALFPNSCFILVTRHPIAVVLATQKWSHTSLHALFEHWLHCHEVFDGDRRFLEKVLHISYEQLASAPEATISCVAMFLGMEPWPLAVKPHADVNERYFSEWRRLTSSDDDARKRVGTIPERIYRKILRTAYAGLHVHYTPLDMRAEAMDSRAYFEERVRRFGYSLLDV